jgi:hypothetical protein
MNLKLVLTLTVLLACAPVMFAQQGVQWIAERGATTQTEPAGQGFGCVVIGADLFRPGIRIYAGSGNGAEWNLPLGDKLACAAAPTEGV